MGVIGEGKGPRSSCGTIIPVRSYSEPADDVAQTPPPVLSGWREPDVRHIERHGIMDTAEYTFTVGGSIFFPAICPRVRRSWLCGDASHTGQQVGPCWKPPRATDGIISACFRCRMHTGFAGRHHAANMCGSCDAMPRPLSEAGFRIPFLLISA